jgi:hypothetical protein
MIAWLSSFKDREEDMLQLCQFAYGARVAPYMKELNKRSGKGSTTLTEELNETNFLKLQHFIGCLGSHMKATRTLIAAAMRFPVFFNDFEIECLPLSKPAKSPPIWMS